MLGEGGGGCGFSWLRLWPGVWEVWLVPVSLALPAPLPPGVEVVAEAGTGMLVAIAPVSRGLAAALIVLRMPEPVDARSPIDGTRGTTVESSCE